MTKKEKHTLRSWIGQIGWVSGQTRPALVFDYCDLSLSSCVKNGTVKDLFHANKVMAKAKMDNLVLVFPSFCKPKSLCISTYNDTSFGYLMDGGSQGVLVSFLADSTGLCCPVMWQSRKLKHSFRLKPQRLRTGFRT